MDGLLLIGTLLLASYVTGQELRVTSILEQPYLSKSGSGYVGLIKDILDAVSEDQGFTYNIQLVKDGHYGVLVDNRWNGMVGELMRAEADIAAAALTITYMREQVISFTKPYMNLGISLLMNKQDVYYRGLGDDSSWIYLFLQPFSVTGWLLIIITTALALLAFVCIRAFYPGSGPVSDPPAVKLKRSCKATFVGTKGPCGKLPLPLKLLLVFLAAFLLIVICLYIAGLVWLLRTQVNSNRIRIGSVVDAEKSYVSLGALAGGSTQTFFQESNVDLYQRIYRNMVADKKTMVNSTNEGVERVKESGYGLFAESPMLSYITARNCELIQVGKLLNSKAYGLATANNSPWTDRLSSSILKMVEDGRMAKLQKKWFDTKNTCQDRTIDVSSTAKGSGVEYRVLSGSVMTLLGPCLLMIFGILVAVLATVLAIVRGGKPQSEQQESCPMRGVNDDGKTSENNQEV